MDFETPEADAADQARVEAPAADEDPADELGTPFAESEVDPADYADQQRVVPDEEDYEER